jgi:hypothetical protein
MKPKLRGAGIFVELISMLGLLWGHSVMTGILVDLGTYLKELLI